MITRGELMSVRPFPAVIHAALVRSLRQEPAGDTARDFVAGYLACDARSRHALTECLGALGNTGQGGAFWLNGVFGCGKSHLLGLLALLADGSQHEALLGDHALLRPLLDGWPQRLVVHFSLDAYDAGRHSLEDIFWREVSAEWGRRGFAPVALGPGKSGASRTETFADLEAHLSANNQSGLVVCIDELSLFLSGREHGALQLDAAFLQFVGQQTARAPMWIFAALQKTVEDVGGIENYSLSQIRDRYTLLALSQTNLATIVERRLVQPVDRRRLELLCVETFIGMERKFPRLEFGTHEWTAAYPFHPATLLLLETVTGRFFSRTRSGMLFCSRAAGCETGLDSPATERVTVDAVFDYFEPELEGHPELRPLAGVWAAWRDGVAAVAGREADCAAMLRAMKATLLWKMAGLSITPLQLTNALGLDAGLSGDGNYEYGRHLLERIRTHGSFLVSDRGEEPLADRYSVDLGQRVAEIARRHVRAGVENLAAQDSRIASHVLQCCQSEPLPLHDLTAPRSLSLYWKNAPRRLMVEVWDCGSLPALANRVASSREPGSAEDAVLLIAPPFGAPGPGHEELGTHLDEAQRGALWVWRPRAPLRDEWEMAREATAAALLEGDPVLEDNRRGRAVLEFLRKEAPARSARLARLALRLLREGEIFTATGASVDAGELVRGDNFTALLESVADFGWSGLFPQFETVAPRARLLTPSNADALCLEILRRPATEPYFSPAVDRLARHIGEPLGVARPVSGRWQIAGGRPELTGRILEMVGQGVAHTLLEAQLAKGGVGLRPEQCNLLVCALLRSGELVARDAQSQEIVASQLGLPLRRSAHSLAPGRLVSAEVWGRVRQLGRLLCRTELGQLCFAEQEKARLSFLAWREAAEGEANLARARVTQLRRQLGQQENQWPLWEGACRAVADALQLIQPELPAVTLLDRLVQLDPDALREPLAVFENYCCLAEARVGALLRGHALLTNPKLQVDGELAASRSRLLLRFDEGEALLMDDDLFRELEAWRENYSVAYAEWHAGQHHPDRWRSLRRSGNSDAFRALERLGTLINRPFPQAEALKATLHEENAKACPQSGLLQPGEAICGACNLALGERLSLLVARALEKDAAAGFAALRHVLADEAVSQALARQASELLTWDGDPETLLPLLSPSNLRLLDEALRPKRRITRSFGALRSQLEKAITKAEWRAALQSWLEGAEHLAEDDEVALVD